MAPFGSRIQSLNWVPWILVLFFASSVISISALPRIPRLSVHGGFKGGSSAASGGSSLSEIMAKEELQTFYFDQTLDHFNYQPASYKTFKQRYVVSFKNWGGANTSAPIFVYMGEESSLDDDLGVIGFLTDNAPRFNALTVYIEHRFYGQSIPFVNRTEALQDANLRGYFSSAQSLADYAEVISYIKKQLSAESSPVIVVGGSYGGMLAAWFRLKYPHIALGALASSAPVLYFDGVTAPDAYFKVVGQDYKEVSEDCYNTILQLWSELDKVANSTNGLSILQKKFNICPPLSNAVEIRTFLEVLFMDAAQYDRPPNYPVERVCRGISSAPKGADVLDKIYSGIVAFLGEEKCYDLNAFFPQETYDGWGWQTCSELVIPMGGGNGTDTMFPFEPPFDLNQYIDSCNQKYGVPPRPHWITTYFGGQNFKDVMKKFGSNIIFSNGLRDPYSSGGVLEEVSDTILAVSAAKGAHCGDIILSGKTDPDWLVLQRNIELEIISGWIIKYYQDLLQKS